MCNKHLALRLKNVPQAPWPKGQLCATSIKPSGSTMSNKHQPLRVKNVPQAPIPQGQQSLTSTKLSQSQPAMQSSLVQVRLWHLGAACENNSSSSGSDLTQRKTQYIFFLPSLFLTFECFKSSIFDKMDLKNLIGAFAYDKTELPNYNL